MMSEEVVLLQQQQQEDSTAFNLSHLNESILEIERNQDKGKTSNNTSSITQQLQEQNKKKKKKTKRRPILVIVEEFDDDENVTTKITTTQPQSPFQLQPQTAAEAKLHTEDLGKITEYAVCGVYATTFNGPFKYSVEKANKLSQRLSRLKKLLPGKYVHTGNKDNLNDFENQEDTTQHLSIKSCKKGYKICPQLIGQTSRFAEHFHLPSTTTNEDIKDYIVENTTDVLERYVQTTFHCPVLFYNEHKDEALLIRLTKLIDWNDYEHKLSFTHIEKDKEWNESTTLKCGGKTIGEFQIHNHRNCTKFRFDLNNILSVFSSHFEVTNI